ncbi:MAG: SDR family NAD(P)-dependent oxidoreductase [Spirochaetaceae bacterium]|nr:SDR family NAD(P)-dependent oxidoreductase [Spirochaetaceae bacterium]
MTPKTVVITGATSGIGKATAKALAVAGHRVVILARSAKRVAKTMTEIEAALQASGNGDLPAVRTIACDLASTASVRRAAAELHETCPRIDVLINNAGLFRYRRHENADGHELTFAVNHLGHFLLTTLLMDRLRESAPSRVVILGSVAHKVGKIWFDDLQLTSNYGVFRAYGQRRPAHCCGRSASSLSRILLATATRRHYSKNVREFTTCRSCHRNIAPDFRFCPYCGTERIRQHQFRRLLDQSFSDMDGSAQNFSMQWLVRLEERLLTLETDLDSFLSLSSGQRR